MTERNLHLHPGQVTDIFGIAVIGADPECQGDGRIGENVLSPTISALERICGS